MKAMILTTMALALVACSSTPTRQAGSTDSAIRASVVPTGLAESTFDGTGGRVNLVFDDQGNWTKITANGTASLSDDTPSARETALLIATMRAKRSVTEFLNDDVKSSKIMTRVARSYARAFQSEDTGNNAPMNDLEPDSMADLDIDGKGARTEKARQAQRFASILAEGIHDNSAAILKGAYVSHRALQDGQVIVELTATRQSVAAAHQVSELMRGTLK